MTDAHIIAKLDRKLRDYRMATDEARHLAVKLHNRHFGHMDGWQAEEDLPGLLAQINQMTHGLVKPANNNHPKADRRGGVA